MTVIYALWLTIILNGGSPEKPPNTGDKPPVYILNTDPPVDKEHPTKP